tara:strand:- start:377 stop:1267 length:891 start_codon:yes stop_codon:yes gene_type:complete
MVTINKGNRYTRKKQKGGKGGGIQLTEKQIQQLVDTVDKHTVDLNIPDIYKGLPKTMKANKVVIISSLKRLDEKWKMIQKRTVTTNKSKIEELKKERRDEIIQLYSMIPNRLKKDFEINKVFIYYEPHIINIPIYPKSLLLDETSWRTAIERDPTIFYTLSKTQKRNILHKYPDILLKSADRVNINIKGPIRLGNIPDFVRRVDAYKIGKNIISKIGGVSAAVVLTSLLLDGGILTPFLTTALTLPVTELLAPIGAGLGEGLGAIAATQLPKTAAAGSVIGAGLTSVAPTIAALTL